jgi:hypothetical protein
MNQFTTLHLQRDPKLLQIGVEMEGKFLGPMPVGDFLKTFLLCKGKMPKEYKNLTVFFSYCGYDDGIEKAEKDQERHLKKGKGRAASAKRERGELKMKIGQLEHEKAELTGENKQLLRRVDDLLREAADLRAATLLLQREPPIPYGEATEPHG